MHYSSKLQDSTDSEEDDLDMILQRLEASDSEKEVEPPSGGSG